MHQMPSSLPPLFSGDRLVVYGVLKASENVNEGDDNEVRLEGMLRNDENVKHVVKFSTPPIAVENKTNVFLHQLAAKSFIQEKQDGFNERNDGQEIEEAKRSAISISKSANVVSKFTSFVVVDKDSNKPVSGPLQKHFLPYYLSADRARRKASRKPREKRKSTGVSLSLLGSAAPPPALEVEVVDWAAPARLPKNEFGGGVEKSSCTLLDLGTMSQETKEARAALSVISLQKALGSWDLTDQLVSLCGASRDALIKGCPKEIAVDTDEGKLLWATALALVLLMGKFLDQKDEWEMIAEKGSKWMKKNLPAGVKYENVLEAAATTVGVQVQLGQ